MYARPPGARPLRATIALTCLLPACEAADPAASPELRHRALVIGVDGLRPDALTAADAPALHALLERGALTLTAHTQRTGPTTVSGPGWASVLTGVEVEEHGVTGNDDLGSRDPAWPTFPERARDGGLSVAISVHWLGILPLLGPTPFEERYVGDDAGVGASVAARVADPAPDLILSHFDDVDHAGHASGFSADNPAYLQAIADVDAAIAPALEALSTRTEERWRVVLCTDHGGLGTDHSERSADTETIPLGVIGGELGVPANPSHLDVAPTVLDWLGVGYEGLAGESWDRAGGG